MSSQSYFSRVFQEEIESRIGLPAGSQPGVKELTAYSISRILISCQPLA